ncbi:MAG: 30S ribosomal protein S6 [Acidobacteria bacterium]|nr:MAG: 30S ribosomal protein S6 [Acidobacteriota bacterium]
MDRKYEVMFILRPDTAEEDMERLLQTMETNVAATGGKVTGFERMGKRRLAYTVKKFQEGIYVLAFVEGPGSVLKELERRLRVQELVIKFITVRTDEEENRLAKVKKLRDSKVRGQGTQGRAAAAQAEIAAAGQEAETAPVAEAEAPANAAENPPATA